MNAGALLALAATPGWLASRTRAPVISLHVPGMPGVRPGATRPSAPARRDMKGIPSLSACSIPACSAPVVSMPGATPTGAPGPPSACARRGTRETLTGGKEEKKSTLPGCYQVVDEVFIDVRPPHCTGAT